MRKLFKIILCIAVLLINYTPIMGKVTVVNAAGAYTFSIAYQDGDVDVEEGLTYSEAVAKMNAYPSTEMAVAVVKKDVVRNGVNKRIIVNAKYAYAQIDIDWDTYERRKGDEQSFVLHVCSNPNDIRPIECTDNKASYIASLAVYWGVDSAFLDYDPNNFAMKIKISGLTGWVREDYVDIVPISRYYGTYNTNFYSNNYPRVYTTESALNVRKEPSASSEVLGIMNQGTSSSNLYRYYPSKSTTEADGCTWYNIDYGNQKGYVCSTYVHEVNKMLSDTYYYVNGSTLKLRIHKGKDVADISTTAGPAPFYYDSTGKHNLLRVSGTSETSVATENRYYSFDGNYFYDKFSKMIDDYREGKHDRALNANHAYYSYFAYLPAHSISGYSADALDQIVRDRGLTVFPTNSETYVNEYGAWIKNLAGNESMMVGIGKDIISAQNSLGINALKIFGAAINESDWGRSQIAVGKKNLFGMGASDDAPFRNARTYNTILDSINDYASGLSSGAYATPYGQYYYGTHFGSKASGQMVHYATDPYSGYSKAAAAFENDRNYGGLDLYGSTLGVTNNTPDVAVKVYREPSSASGVIYETKNYRYNRIIYDMPFIVTEKVTVKENNEDKVFYKVYTDFALDSNRNLVGSATYNTLYSYGYIKAEDLNLTNTAPEITSEADEFEIDQYTECDPKSFVTVKDLEDDIDHKPITVSVLGEFKPNVSGTYNLQIVAIDSSNLMVRKDITINVKQVGPQIRFVGDTDTVEVKQYKTFDLKSNVTADDLDDGDLTDKIIVSGDLDTNVMGSYILTYTVTDNDGNVSSIKRTVNVVANDKPVITAINKTIYSFDYENKEYDYLAGITASDTEDGNVTNSITYEGTVNPRVIGTYEITYSAKDLDNQTSSLTVTITVEEKQFNKVSGSLNLYSLEYKEDSKLLEITGYLAIKNINATNDYVSYSIVFENQLTGNTIIKSLTRSRENNPASPKDGDGYDYDASWFKEELDLSDLPSGNYSVYIRGRSGDSEAKESLNNRYLRSNVAGKFKIDSKGFQFKVNYYTKGFPLELFVRSEGLPSTVNNSIINNMFNQVHTIDLSEEGILSLVASSHNVNGDYSNDANITRKVYLENISTFVKAITKDVGHLSNRYSTILKQELYLISLRVPDGKDKTNAWYETQIDLKELSAGTYSIIVYTKTGDIEDHGELYDITFKKLAKSITVGNKKISISRNDNERFRIEITVEEN